ncbi:hypothetical protein RGU12_22470 [Fredinandcohnia sp. QZ13]|uniref:hypothetical protein n=1 Tax=Fredinandcohnia sp. QZ13 TaxID=3073144 RepID=UPI0028535331|nr:hypothetical protein [Fredinandcohnia sp. QZ13]MDR4890270.1 hypothetical protein [Fredinandcohnia sp. QZ13]
MLQRIDKAYWVVLLIISIIVGVIVGFIGPTIFHHIFFKNGDTFLVLTPSISNIFMFIAVGFFILFCIGMIVENKKWNYVGILFLVCSIAMGYYASFGNYTLISNNEITIKKSMSEKVYKWDEIKEVAYINETEEPVKRIHLILENGKEETLEINRQYVQELNKIQQKFIQNDIMFYK